MNDVPSRKKLRIRSDGTTPMKMYDRMSFPADAPEQPPLHEENKAGQEEQDRERERDCCGRAEHAQERRHVADQPDERDEDFENGGNDEEPPGPGVQKQVARRPTRVVRRHWRFGRACRRRAGVGVSASRLLAMPIENRMITDYRIGPNCSERRGRARSVSVPARSDNPLTKDRCLQ